MGEGIKEKEQEEGGRKAEGGGGKWKETRSLKQVYRAEFNLKVLRKNISLLGPSSQDHSHLLASDHFLLFKAI